MRHKYDTVIRWAQVEHGHRKALTFTNITPHHTYTFSDTSCLIFTVFHLQKLSTSLLSFSFPSAALRTCIMEEKQDTGISVHTHTNHSKVAAILALLDMLFQWSYHVTHCSTMVACKTLAYELINNSHVHAKLIHSHGKYHHTSLELQEWKHVQTVCVCACLHLYMQKGKNMKLV